MYFFGDIGLIMVLSCEALETNRWFVSLLAAAYPFSLSVVTLHFLYSLFVSACFDIALILSLVQIRLCRL